MSTKRSKLVTIMALASLALAGVATTASAGSARLYELTENMKVVSSSKRGQTTSRRTATAALTGVAEVGTPLCPDKTLASGPGGCAVNVIGMDDVSLVTGFGTLAGTSTTVMQGDNPVDGPEAVVLTSNFTGLMDFSPAIVHQIPYGTVAGRVATGRRAGAPFTGVFRLPFAGNVEVEIAPSYTLTLRQIFCPLSPETNRYAPIYGGWDLAYLDFTAEGEPNGQCLDIQPTELSLGAPLVRFDVKF